MYFRMQGRRVEGNVVKLHLRASCQTLRKMILYLLREKEGFHANEKICLCFRVPRRIIKAMNDYVYHVDDLRNGLLDEIHIYPLKFYHDKSLDIDAIMFHVLKLETGLVVNCLNCITMADNGLMVRVRWRELPESEDTLELISQVYEARYVPQIGLLENILQDLVLQANKELKFS